MGKLIVIEGTDGSGKATQTRKLFERLEDLGSSVMRISFPNYESESSALIKMYLRGDLGNTADSINAYAAATFYAVDRFASYKEWKDFYERGGIILSDRYVASNMAYQAAKIVDQTKRAKFLAWLEDLEYEKFELPRPDLSIFLDMTVEISAFLRRERGREDIHEDDFDYTRRVYEVYKELSQRFNWKVVKCADKNFARSAMNIHEDVFRIVEEILI